MRCSFQTIAFKTFFFRIGGLAGRFDILKLKCRFVKLIENRIELITDHGKIRATSQLKIRVRNMHEKLMPNKPEMTFEIDTG